MSETTSDQQEPVEEETPLLLNNGALQPADYNTLTQPPAADRPSTGVWATLSVLLIGVFVSQTDQSLVLATYARVASEFGDLSAGSWLLSSYILAQCVSQPLYGKLSDIYGRKTLLQAAYVFFAVGTLGCGVGSSLGEVITARVVQGIGGAGMLSMVSIIITDLVPVHEVGQLRSYVNILQTTGRGCGGVIGGFLTGTIGWRAAFLIQVPPTLIAIALVQWRLHLPRSEDKQTAWTKLKRVDFIGAFFLCLTIGSWCFILDNVGSQLIPMDSSIVIAMAVIGGISTIAFVLSGHYATEPIFPLRIWTQRAVFTNYAIVSLQTMMQVTLMTAVPLYVQATSNVSVTAVGAYLIPAFAGNTVGGLMAGYWVKKTKTHLPITIFGTLMGNVCMTLCILIWKGERRVSVLESLVIVPGGFSVGVVSSSAFVALAAGVDPQDVAIAGSGMYTFFSIGAIAGVSAGSAVYQTTLQNKLKELLTGVSGAEQIIRHALDDVTYVQRTEEWIRKLIVPAFVEAFHHLNYLGLICTNLSLLFALGSPGGRLVKKPDPEQGTD